MPRQRSSSTPSTLTQRFPSTSATFATSPSSPNPSAEYLPGSRSSTSTRARSPTSSAVSRPRYDQAARSSSGSSAELHSNRSIPSRHRMDMAARPHEEHLGERRSGRLDPERTSTAKRPDLRRDPGQTPRSVTFSDSCSPDVPLHCSRDALEPNSERLAVEATNTLGCGGTSGVGAPECLNDGAPAVPASGAEAVRGGRRRVPCGRCPLLPSARSASPVQRSSVMAPCRSWCSG